MKKETARNAFDTITLVVAMTVAMLLVVTLIDGIYKSCHAGSVSQGITDYNAVADILVNMDKVPAAKRPQVAINYMLNIMKDKRRVAYLNTVAEGQGTELGNAIAKLAEYVYYNLMK